MDPAPADSGLRHHDRGLEASAPRSHHLVDGGCTHHRTVHRPRDARPDQRAADPRFLAAGDPKPSETDRAGSRHRLGRWRHRHLRQGGPWSGEFNGGHGHRRGAGSTGLRDGANPRHRALRGCSWSWSSVCRQPAGDPDRRHRNAGDPRTLFQKETQSSASISPALCGGFGLSKLGGRQALRPLRATPVRSSEGERQGADQA